MINSIFSFFIVFFFARFLIHNRRPLVWMALSAFAFLQVSPSTLWAILGLLIVQEGIVYLFKEKPWRFLPLIYAAVLIVAHHFSKGHITGFSYLVLSSSVDIWWRVNGRSLNLRERAINLLSFPKALVGPITSADDHRPAVIESERVAWIALLGVLKVFVLVNLWRVYVPAPLWDSLQTPLDYFGFGLWNYIHLYLEFSGACELVAAAFWVFGFGCPLNFDRPYLSISITEFWKRWHITLGLWIKNFVFIPLGGSRVSKSRVYINLLLAMTLSGAWHGLTKPFIAWGILQGVFLCVERALNLERRLQTATRPVKLVSWFITQLLVTLSWICFFGRF